MLWLDLETTGLDVERDEIVEVAVIGTDDDLNPIFEFSEVCRPSKHSLYNELMSLDFHAINGLASDVATSTQTIGDVENALLAELERIAGPVSRGSLILAGSGVGHFDRKFIAKHMHRLDQLLHYRPIDVGSARELFLRTQGRLHTEVNNLKTHRALDDVNCHLAEARAFAGMFAAAS